MEGKQTQYTSSEVLWWAKAHPTDSRFVVGLGPSFG